MDISDEIIGLDLTATLCIDNDCEDYKVFKDLEVPIPVCFSNMTQITLPGDGSIESFIDHLDGAIGSTAVAVVLEKLGFAVSPVYLSSLPVNTVIIVRITLN